MLLKIKLRKLKSRARGYRNLGSQCLVLPIRKNSPPFLIRMSEKCGAWAGGGAAPRSRGVLVARRAVAGESELREAGRPFTSLRDRTHGRNPPNVRAGGRRSPAALVNGGLWSLPGSPLPPRGGRATPSSPKSGCPRTVALAAPGGAVGVRNLRPALQGQP